MPPTTETTTNDNRHVSRRRCASFVCSYGRRWVWGVLKAFVTAVLIAKSRGGNAFAVVVVSNNKNCAAATSNNRHRSSSSWQRRQQQQQIKGQPRSPNVPSYSRCSTVRRGMWSQDDELVGSDRLKACFPYLLPLIDGEQFGRYVFERVPLLGDVNDFLLGPFVHLQHNVPFFGVGFFVLLTLGTRFNTDTMSRNVRFSAQQAALIDVGLIVPELLGTAFSGDAQLPRSVMEPCTNFVFYAYASTVMYCVYCNLRGKRPDQIPIISPAADMMTGPF